MKLSKISQICKRHPNLRVFETEQAQWVSIGAAAYPMYGMPTISDEAELLSVIDVPEEKRGPYEVQFIPPDNPWAFGDSADGEEMLRTVRYSFMQYGSVMMPLYTPDGRVYWINECYLAPAEDEKDLTFWLREIWPGMYAVAVKSGFEIVALIGVKIATSETEESLREILGGIQMADRKGYRIPMEMVEQYRGYQLPVTGFSERQIEEWENRGQQERIDG